MTKISAHLVFKKVDILKRFHPEWVDGGPGQPGPVVSKALRDFLISGVIRDLAGLVGNAGVAREMHAVAQGMAKHAVGGLLAGWDDGDDLCPPWRWPFGGPKPRPGPDPWWFEVGLLDRGDFAWLDAAPKGSLDPVIAFGVRQLAAMASDAGSGRKLEGIVEQLAKAA